MDKRKAATIVATLLFAFGFGHVTQNGDAIAARLSSIQNPSKDTPGLVKVPELAASLPRPPMEAILPIKMSREIFGNSSRVVANTSEIDANLQNDLPTPLFFDNSCDPEFSVVPAPGAMVQLTLDAPCYQNQRITVAHSGLEFADATNTDGTYRVEIPALHENAPFSVVFSDGRSVEASTLMLTIDGYERAVVMWNGAPNLHIHALEFGAGYGDAGHVWADAARDPGFGVRAEGGFLIKLGNPDVFQPRLAEIYSFPYDRMQGEGAVQLVVEVGVTGQSCSTEISAKSIQLSGAGAISSTDVSLEIPECGGENGFLVLNNLLIDLNIAQN